MDITGDTEIVLKYDGLVHLTFALVARGMEFILLFGMISNHCKLYPTVSLLESQPQQVMI